MKANELMIGDWVRARKYNSDSLPEVVKVRCCDVTDRIYAEKGNGLIMEFDRIEPIPLTPEILEKNGFTNYGESWYIPNTKDCVMVGFHMYETTINISKDRVSFFKSTPCEYRSHYSLRKVFVHELQHAIQLCGIEKEITI